MIPEMTRFSQQEDALIFDLREEDTEPICFRSEPSIAQLVSILKAFTGVLTAADELLLDRDRWGWDPSFWRWDPANGRLKGIYIPDRRYSRSFILFLQDYIRELIERCLEQGWENETLILYLHHLYRDLRNPDPTEDIKIRLNQLLEENTRQKEMVPLVRNQPDLGNLEEEFEEIPAPMKENPETNRVFRRIRSLFSLPF